MTLYAAEQRSESRSKTGAALADQPWWPWAWMGLAALLLGVSGLVRVWQDHRLDDVVEQAVGPMFPLKELPTKIGAWEAQPGGEAVLDPRVAQIAGSTDSLVRNYVDKETGVVVTLLLLYGRADRITGHTPEVCYPAIGFRNDEHIIDEEVRTLIGPAFFRSTVYARKGAVTERQEVYYAFRNQGAWSPTVAGNWRTLRTSPALIKVQVQRRAGETERRWINNPTKVFLAALIPVLEGRIRAAEGSAPAAEPARAGSESEPAEKAAPPEAPKAVEVGQPG